MAILSKHTTIGGKIPLTTDMNIASDKIKGIATITLSGDINADTLLTPGNYNFKDVTNVSNFPEYFTVNILNNYGAVLIVLPINEQKYIQYIIDETYTLVRYNLDESTWAGWENVNVGNGSSYNWLAEENAADYLPNRPDIFKGYAIDSINSKTSIAGSKAFKLQSFTLSNNQLECIVDDISVLKSLKHEMRCSIYTNKYYHDIGEIVDIIDNGFIIYPVEQDIHWNANGTNVVTIVNHPELGDTVIGSYSYAEGKDNKTIGYASHAEGNQTIASANNSHTEGCGTIASGENQHVQGKYNKVDSTMAHIVGGGTNAAEENRKNIHTVDWQGNAWFAGRLSTGDNLAGITGYYFTDINFEKKEITLSETQGQAPTSEFYTSYEVGDVISLTNNAKYYNCSTITEINKNTITVKSLPFSEMYKTDTPTPDEWNFFVINKPTQGAVKLGLNASAFGENTNALERSSHAEGRDTIAYGSYSHAEGRETQAGFTAHAEGRKTIASGEFSHAEGLRTKAIGNRSHAEGENSEALDLYTHAEGYETKASGEAAHAEGYRTKSTSNYAHSEGFTTTASGQSSHAEGSDTNATGSAAHSEGGATTASGVNSHAEGLNSTALGEAAHSEGFGTFANADRSHAEGQNTQANGHASHSEGVSSITSGEGAHAEGFSTIVSGNYSHAEGFGTIASGDSQHVEGKYNQEDNNHKYIHIAGNGYVDENSKEVIRKNAHTLDWQGNAWFAGNITVGNDKKRILTEDDLSTIPGGTTVGETIEVSSIILKSSDGSGKKYKLSINNDGYLVATEI